MFDSCVFSKEMAWTGGILDGIGIPLDRQRHLGHTDWTIPAGYSVRQVIFGW